MQEAYAAMFPAPRQYKITAMAVPEEQIPLSTSRRLLDLIPNSEPHVFASCGHWVQIEHADGFNTLVSSFLSGDL